MKIVGQIKPCLWFDTNALEAAKFYVSVFENSRMGAVSHYGKAGQDVHGMKVGTVLAKPRKRSGLHQ
jgi:predicted 3-demethylubiquinone-9 3-methyltransferase (glyoxalase superfamily)